MWSPAVPGKCLNTIAIIYAGAALNIVEDIVIIILPIAELSALKLDARKKIVLGVLFTSGSLWAALPVHLKRVKLTFSRACITSMVRLKYIITFGNTVDSTCKFPHVLLPFFPPELTGF